MHRRYTHAPLREWPSTAHGQRDVDASELHDGECIARCVPHRVVAVHGGDTDEIEMPRRKQYRDRIVMPRIAVDQDLGLVHVLWPQLSSWPAVTRIASILLRVSKLGMAYTRMPATAAQQSEGCSGHG
jgi:hypothetical protein